MKAEDGKFYFMKDSFFEVFKEYKIMENKESGNKRPCYFCFRDRKDERIIWFVPISTKYDKYKKIYESKKSKAGKRPVFLIQNIFPTTEKYIEEKYTNSNIDVEIPAVVKEEIIKTALRVVRLAEEGIHIPFYDITEMKNILLK